MRCAGDAAHGHARLLARSPHGSGQTSSSAIVVSILNVEEVVCRSAKNSASG